MKSIKDIITENKDNSQDYRYWCQSIIEKMTIAFEEYGHKNNDQYPDNFYEDIMKYADKEDIYDSIWALYKAWDNKEYILDDITRKKLKFI